MLFCQIIGFSEEFNLWSWSSLMWITMMWRFKYTFQKGSYCFPQAGPLAHRWLVLRKLPFPQIKQKTVNTAKVYNVCIEKVDMCIMRAREVWQFVFSKSWLWMIKCWNGGCRWYCEKGRFNWVCAGDYFDVGHTLYQRAIR
jgi:hypothetical protein